MGIIKLSRWVTRMFLLAMVFVFSWPATAEVVFSEGFDAGWGNWWAGNGVWDVGATPLLGVAPMAADGSPGSLFSHEYLMPIHNSL